jgi:hypothetical protein
VAYPFWQLKQLYGPEQVAQPFPQAAQELEPVKYAPAKHPVHWVGVAGLHLAQLLAHCTQTPPEITEPRGQYSHALVELVTQELNWHVFPLNVNPIIHDVH